MLNPIKINEVTTIRQREDGGLFLAKFAEGGLHHITLTNEELQEILSYYECD